MNFETAKIAWHEVRTLDDLNYNGYININPAFSPGTYRKLNSLFKKNLAIKSNRRLDGFYTFYSLNYKQEEAR